MDIYVKVLANKYRSFHHVLLFLLLGDLQAATIHTVVGEMYKDQNVKCIIKHKKEQPNPTRVWWRKTGKLSLFIPVRRLLSTFNTDWETDKVCLHEKKKKDWRSATHKAVHKKARVKGDGETVK